MKEAKLSEQERAKRKRKTSTSGGSMRESKATTAVPPRALFKRESEEERAPSAPERVLPTRGMAEEAVYLTARRATESSEEASAL